MSRHSFYEAHFVFDLPRRANRAKRSDRAEIRVEKTRLRELRKSVSAIEIAARIVVEPTLREIAGKARTERDVATRV